MRRTFVKHSLLVFVFCFCLSSRLKAQDAATGAIAGTVNDASGAAITNAEVHVISADTLSTRVLRTDGQGKFRAPLLPPGSYEVIAEASGFTAYKSPILQVTVSEISSLMVTLSVQQGVATAQVNGDSEIAQIESSSLGRALDEKAISSLPLANRNFTQILGLSPGVAVALPSAADLGSGTQNVASNGAKTTANNIQFNGVDANNLAQNSAANDDEEAGVGIPAPDSIQTFKVQTASYDAAYRSEERRVGKE